MSRNELQIKLVRKAWEDKQFKKFLLNNTKAVFEKELGEKLPEDMEIIALEEKPDKMYIILPVKADQGQDQGCIWNYK